MEPRPTVPPLRRISPASLPIKVTEIPSAYRQTWQPNKICRVCLGLVEECIDINTVEETTGFMPYRDKLALVVPEMMLDMIQSPVICVSCCEQLNLAYEFKQKCMQTEEKIRRLVQSYGGVLYSLDLTNIANKPKVIIPQAPKPVRIIKFPPAVVVKVDGTKSAKEIEFETAEEIAEKMKQVVKKDTVTVTTKEEVKDEMEEEAVEEEEEEEEVEEEAEDPLLVPQTSSEQTEIEEKIATYKKQQEIKCNFCGQSFLGMFCLRNHQRLCSGAIAHSAEIKAETEKVKAQPIPCHVPILRKKRKHKTGPVVKQPRPRPGTRITLPLQAKGILQKWLFAHRDNPYPTDVDKLELIEQTNLTLVQVENWFINARRRILQKMLSKGNQYEKMLKKEGKGASSDEEWVA